MNIYQRLINILSESINPEYWSASELMHYLKLAQNNFARETRITRKNVKLASAYKSLSVGSSLDFIASEYDLPSDCLEIMSVQFKGKPLDKKDITFLEAAYSGTSSQEVIKGSGRINETGWRQMTGTPIHWIFDNKKVRVFPAINEVPETVIIPSDIENSNVFAVDYVEGMRIVLLFYNQIIENNEVYTKESIFIPLTKDKYFFSTRNNQIYLSFSDEYIKTLRRNIEDGWNIEIIAYAPSDTVTADYVYEPALKILRPDKYDEENAIIIELPEQWHEAIACYAAYLALSKEGDKTQDLAKANIYLQRYQDYVAQAKRLAEGEIDIDPFVQLPFVI